MQTADFKALGTDIYLELTTPDFEWVLAALKYEADRFEKKYSRFIASSELCQLNAQLDKWHAVDEEWLYLLDQYLLVSAQTDQHICLATTALLEHWGYDATYNLKASAPVKTFAPLQLEIKNKRIRFNQPLDFGCLGKGHFLDQCRKILLEHQVETYLINAGGDLTFKGTKTQKLFLEDPRIKTRVIGECHLRDGFLCASSPSRRQWGDFHHLINVPDQLPAQAMQAVYVYCEATGLITDALSTAFFVMGYEKARRLWPDISNGYPNAALMLISGEGQVWQSDNFKVNLFTS